MNIFELALCVLLIALAIVVQNSISTVVGGSIDLKNQFSETYDCPYYTVSGFLSSSDIFYNSTCELNFKRLQRMQTGESYNLTYYINKGYKFK